MFGLGLYLLLQVGGILVQALEVATVTASYARLAGEGNGGDPNTGQPVAPELAQAIGRIVPVASATVGESSALPGAMPAVGVGGLAVAVNGVNTGEVTTTVAYGFSIPFTGLAGTAPSVIPMTVRLTFPATTPPNSP